MSDEHKHAVSQDWARLGPFDACTRLGLQYRREGRSAFVLCPWHREKTPSCTVAIGSEGTLRVHCFACSETWDVFSLIAQLEGRDVTRDFPDVLSRAAELVGRWDVVDELAGREVKREAAPMPARPLPEPEPERLYPTETELDALLTACVRVTSDREVSNWIRSRGLDPLDVAIRGLAVALPPSAALPPWARYRGESWVETGHRLIVECFDAHGVARSVRGCRVTDGDSPKRLPPAGCRASGLVLADAMGQEMLAHGWPLWAGAPRVVIVEGEPDFLTMACELELLETPPHAVLGIWSGSWSADIAARIPDGAKVAVWTDADEAGEKYAAAIRGSLEPRCKVIRRVAQA